MVNEQVTRELAYSLWEKAGKPESDGVHFWLEAEVTLALKPKRKRSVSVSKVAAKKTSVEKVLD